MKNDKIKSVVVLTVTGFICSLLLYVVVKVTWGNLWKQYGMVL